MHIYIDESGSFRIPKGKRAPSICCVGALIIPDGRHDDIVAGFVELSRSWPEEKGEVKGKLLNEAQVNEAIGFLAERGVLFDCVAADLGLHRVAEVNAHKDQQARNVTKVVTPRHRPSLITQLRDLAARLRAITLPKYLQVVALTQLVRAVLSTKTLYFAQCAPQEIGAFWWTVDAKDRSLTRSERLWGELVLPLLQAQSHREPLVQLEGADYSAYARFERAFDQPPDHIRPIARNWKPGEPYLATDIRMIMNEHRAFADSTGVVGLQMADVVTNAAARALKGNLKDAGWHRLGALMVQQFKEYEIIRMIQLGPQKRVWRPAPPYNRVLRHLRRTARPLIVEK